MPSIPQLVTDIITERQAVDTQLLVLNQRRQELNQQHLMLDFVVTMGLNPAWETLTITATSSHEYGDDGGSYLSWSIAVQLATGAQDLHYADYQIVDDQLLPGTAIDTVDAGSTPEEIAEALEEIYRDEMELGSEMATLYDYHPAVIVWQFTRDLLPAEITPESLSLLFSQVDQSR